MGRRGSRSVLSMTFRSVPKLNPELKPDWSTATFLALVLPDSPGSETSRPKSGRTSLFVVAGLIIVVGFAVMGSLSPADPVAIEETTTTSTTIDEVDPPIDPENFTVAQIARGEPLDWEPAMILDDSYPMALFDHEGWIYLFSTERPNFSGFEQGGLRGWRSADGESWEPLGQAIAERHTITHVASTGQGLVALESRGDDTGFDLWRSPDGVDWTVEEVAVDAPGPARGFVPMSVGGSDVVTVVAGNTYVDVHSRLQERLGELGSGDLDLAFLSWGMQVEGEDVEFSIYGPLGFLLATITGEEVGLSPEEVEALIADQRGRDPTTVVWTRTGEAGWRPAEIPGAFSIEFIEDTRDGGILAFGYGGNGFTTWSSRDGFDWVKAEAFEGPYRVDEWRGRLVGVSDTGRPTVVAMADDGSWDDLGPAKLFPSGFSWSVSTAGAGPGGIAAFITGWDGSVPPQIDLPDPVHLTSEDSTLVLDLATNTYSLETADGVTHRWSMNETTPEGISVDMEAAAIVFHDPESGDRLASFSIDEIAEGQNSYWGFRPWSTTHRAFAFTRDGVEWTIQDGAAIGADVEIMHLEVSETRVIAAGINNAGVYDPSLSPGFGVWSAAIP